MKIYTKEMFLLAAEKCETSMIDANHIMKYIDEYVTPIEIPSDDDIEKESSKWIAPSQAFRGGAKWMKEQIIKKANGK